MKKMIKAFLREVKLERTALAIWRSFKNEKPSALEHGHALLIEQIINHANTSNVTLRDRVLVEIGATREHMKGQGSTSKLAMFAKANGLHFISVDMDPELVHAADRTVKAIDTSFEAIRDRGEHFLETYPGWIDYLYLDAFDIDHGRHSEDRRRRYMKNLGVGIDNQQCWEMHLQCAKAVEDKLVQDGIIVFDDTWIDQGSQEWCGKGKLAVPYLLDKGLTGITTDHNSVALSKKGR